MGDGDDIGVGDGAGDGAGAGKYVVVTLDVSQLLMSWLKAVL